MSRIHTGKIKVMHADDWCFPVDKDTLLCTGPGNYEEDPFNGLFPVETISYAEWLARREKLEKLRK